MTITSRTDAPVFVVGSPRSGTTLLYHMLLSAGGFARYRAETHVFNTLAPRFGGLRSRSDIDAALRVWLASDCHVLTGLAADEVRERVHGGARNAGDFLRIIMEMLVERQGARRWAETTPAHVLHMREIADQIPGALFIHVIRDGRDVATSLEKQQWIRPLAVDRGRPVLAAAAYWDWMVRRARAEGRRVDGAYCEVRYESLVATPQQALDEIAAFIGQPLDWEAIQRVGIGSVGKPNTSFPGAQGGFNARWRSQLSVEDARDVDALLAPTLRAFGYPSEASHRTFGLAWRRWAYHARFSLRDRLKRGTRMGRRVTDLSHFQPGTMRVTAEKLEGLHRGASTSSV